MSGPELTADGRRVAVDHSLCGGTGHCQDIVPEVFRLDKVERRAKLRDDADLAEADADRLARAEASCPWFAITFEGEDER
ncbi:ferredoxin [Saccharopolyspora shandongensis]|uniref:ferredoxin n=1 Tax=Saccharopolyspora shandongensis TaxID=418495 RepID=UPI0033C488F7